MDNGQTKKVKIVAELTTWSGEKETAEIQRDWIDDIVAAIQGQFTIINNQKGLCIRGGQYCHVDIYEVENDID